MRFGVDLEVCPQAVGFTKRESSAQLFFSASKRRGRRQARQSYILWPGNSSAECRITSLLVPSRSGLVGHVETGWAPIFMLKEEESIPCRKSAVQFSRAAFSPGIGRATCLSQSDARARKVYPAPQYRHPTTCGPPSCLVKIVSFQLSQSVNKGSGVENLHYLGDGLFGTKQLD